MKNATKKAEPVQLGTKRTCPNCSTKFYDFQKSPVTCPKCSNKFDPSAQPTLLRAAPEPKKEKKAEKIGPEAALLQDEDTPAAGSDEFEVVDDLDSDDEEVVEDIVEDDGDDDDKKDDY